MSASGLPSLTPPPLKTPPHAWRTPKAHYRIIGNAQARRKPEVLPRSGLRAADAIIAATATEHHLSLVSGNVKPFKLIHDLRLIPFTP